MGSHDGMWGPQPSVKDGKKVLGSLGRRVVHASLRHILGLLKPAIRRLSRWQALKQFVLNVVGRESQLAMRGHRFLTGKAPTSKISIISENSLTHEAMQVLVEIRSMRRGAPLPEEDRRSKGR
jgi:hypothetical protein